MEKDINLVWKTFEDNTISHSATHYLFTIHELKEKNGYARMIDVSKKLKITPGSCSIGVKSLVKKGFITEDQNKFLKLSKKGDKIIDNTLKARKVLINFFISIGVSEKEATVNACKIEHLIDIKVIEKIEQKLN